MNVITPLKNLSLISTIALGLALSPTISMADNADRGHNKTQYSHDRGQSRNKGHDRHESRKSQRNSYVARSLESRRHGKRQHQSNIHYGRIHGNNAYHTHGNHGHNHGHSSHNHTNYVVRDYAHQDNYIGLDNLRFMFGLHTGNFDIIFRD